MELYNSKRDVSSLIQVFTSGEALNTEQVRRFKDLLQCSANKVNELVYPTEATVDVTYYDCDLEKRQCLFRLVVRLIIQSCMC